MKALLVVDVDEKHLLLESNDLYDRMKGRRCTLAPMPQKQKHHDEIDYDYGFIDGWNACLEELEK